MRKRSKVLLRGSLALAMACTLITPLQSKAASSEASKIVSDMTLRQKIAQMVMPDFRYWDSGDGQGQVGMTVLNDDIRKIIEDYDFGGVILFAQNVVGTEQTTRLTYDLQQTAIQDGNLPLLIGIDQEGGNVTRLGTGTSLPGNMALGATKDPDAAYAAGEILGTELSALGINVNFAPSLDTNNNPANPVIGERSISSDPELVAKLGVPLLQGIQSANVGTAIKHFPGHGDTATDSHTGLPSVNKTYEQIKDFELVPFQAAANEGTDMIMTAHIAFPQIEKDTYTSKKDGQEVHIPATLSDDIITGIIREKMGFDGVVITDALNMDAIATHFSQLEAARMAINADVDILLMPVFMRSAADEQLIEDYIGGIETMVNDGSIDEATITKSAERIVQMKIDRGIINLGNDTESVEAKVAKANAIVGSVEHHKIEREITQKAITVSQNHENTLPLAPKAGEHVLLLGAYANELPALQYGFLKLQEEGVIDPDVTFETMRYSSATTEAALYEKIDAADFVISITELSSQANLQPTHWISKYPDLIVNRANENATPVVLMSIGKPYDAARYPDADAMVLAYASKGMDPTEAGQEPSTTYGPNIPASMDIIFGKVAPSGTLPVDVPKLNDQYQYTDEMLYRVGDGITNLQETEGTITIKTDKETIVKDETFQASVTLHDLENLTEQGFALSFDVDEHFDVIEVKAENATVTSYEVKDGVLSILAVPKEDATEPMTFTITMKANEDGSEIPLILRALTDDRGRTFLPEVTGYAAVTVKTETTDPKDEPKDEPKGETPEKPTDTGKKPENIIKKTGTSTASMNGTGLSAVLLLLAGAYIVLVHPRREEE